jgi:hypothetical protein
MHLLLSPVPLHEHDDERMRLQTRCQIIHFPR